MSLTEAGGARLGFDSFFFFYAPTHRAWGEKWIHPVRSQFTAKFLPRRSAANLTLLFLSQVYGSFEGMLEKLELDDEGK